MNASGEDGSRVEENRRTVITVEHVSKQYRSRKGALVQALEDVSLTVGEGELVALLGPSGCGKSTLLKIIAGLQRATSGDIQIEGQRVTRPYTNLGIVFQQDLLLEWKDVVSNVLMQYRFRGKRAGAAEAEEAQRLLLSVGLGGAEHRYPYELSGGMRQRVSICRALVHNPPLLLFDEPFGALDALTRDTLRIDLRRILTEGNKAAVLVTHDIDEAVFLAQRIVVMTPSPGRIHAVHEIQFTEDQEHVSMTDAAFIAYVRLIRSEFEELGVLRSKLD